MFAVSGDERCCVTQEVCGSKETLLRMRRRTASSPWTNRAVPRETSKDKGQANLQDSSRAPHTFGPGLYNRQWRNLWVSSLRQE